jgi:hypothetical protein
VFRIRDILVWIRIRGSMPLTNGSGSFYFRHGHSRGQTKNKFFLKFFCLLLFEGTFTLFFKDKKYKRSHKTVGIMVFILFLLDDRESVSGPGAGSGSIPLTCGSGSARHKNMWIRWIQIRNTAWYWYLRIQICNSFYSTYRIFDQNC